MSKKLSSFILIFFMLVSCVKEKQATRNSIENPSEVGKEVFGLLKKMNTIDAKKFIDDVISYETFKELANDKKVPMDEYMRNDLKSITAQTHVKILTGEYNEIKKKGLEYKIDWDKISFVSFATEYQQTGEGKILLGETYFKNTDGKVYFVKLAAFFDGKGYVIVKISEIEPENRGAFNRKPNAQE